MLRVVSARLRTAALVLSVSALALTTAAPAGAVDVPVTPTGDITAPHVSSMTIDTTTVDVRDGQTKTVTATLAATDDLSGVASVDAHYMINGHDPIAFNFSARNRTAGDKNSGVYVTTLTVQPGTPGGTYAFVSLWARDTVGNSRSYYEGTNMAPPELTVISNGDDQPPVVTDVTFGPDPLDVSAGTQQATINVRVTDNVGVPYVFGTLTSPSGRQRVGWTAYAVAGQPGLARGVLRLYRYAEPGTWKPGYLCAEDVSGNRGCHREDSEPTAAAAFPTGLRVVSNPADEVKPVITAIRITAAEIDVTDAARTVQTAVDVTDDLSGVDTVRIRFESPRVDVTKPRLTRWGFSPPRSHYTYAYLPDGTTTVTEVDARRMLTGTLTQSTEFPRFDHAGDWFIAEVCVVDNAGWHNCYTSTSTPSLASLGPVSVRVHSNHVPSVSVTGIDRDAYDAGAEPTVGCLVSDVEDGAVAATTPVIAGPDSGGIVTATCSYTDAGGKTGTGTRSYRRVVNDTTTPILIATPVANPTPVAAVAPAITVAPEVIPPSAAAAGPGDETAASQGRVPPGPLQLAPPLDSSTAPPAAAESAAPTIIGPSAPAAQPVRTLPTIVPAAPARVVAARGHRSAVVMWTPPANGGSAITSYRVVASPGGRSCVARGASRCTVTGLVNGRSYRFSVTAANATSTGRPSLPSAAVVPAPVPGAPRHVRMVRGNGRVTISWAAPSSNGVAAVLGYRVVAGPGGGSCTTTRGLRCTIGGLKNGRSYRFTVVAINRIGASPLGVSGIATPSALPPVRSR